MALKSIIATVQGVEYTLELNPETGYYERTLSPLNDETSFHQPGGYFPVSITAVDTTDLSSSVNSDDYPNLRLFVAENHKPLIEILSPTAGSYITDTSRPEIQFKVTDNAYTGYSGVKKDSIVLKINGQAVSGVMFEDVDGGYIGKYTPDVNIEDGEVVITVDADDNDGNHADTTSAIFSIDTKAPEHSVTTPVNEYTETSSSVVLIEGIVSDDSEEITISITDNGQLVDEFVTSSGKYSKNITLIGQGEHIVVITATDKWGKSTPITRVFKYNTTAPVFTEVGIVLTDGSQVSADNKVPAVGTYTIRCKVVTS